MLRSLSIHGRDDQLTELRRALTAPAPGGCLTLLRGPRGAGRTTLLRAAAGEWRDDGVPVLEVTFEPGTSGLAALLTAFGADAAIGPTGDAIGPTGEGPDTAIGPAGEGQDAAIGPAGDGPDAETAGLVRALLRLGAAVDRVAAAGPLVLIADDTDASADSAIALDAARRPGVLVVASCTEATSELRVAAQLVAAADRIIDLPPLPGDGRAAMIADRLGARPDPALDAALDIGLGTLAGRPAAVLDAIGELRRLGRIVEVHGRLCLIRPDLPLPITGVTTDLLCDRLTGPDRAVLTDLAVNPVRTHELPLLAVAAGVPAEHHGRLTDRLTEAGVLTETTDGHLLPACPAVGAQLVAELGPERATERRRALAEILLTALRDGVAVDPAALGDRIARITPRPFDGALGLLLGLIGRTGTDPARRANWLRAAWQRLPAEPVRTRIATDWLRDLLCAGRFTALGVAVEAVLTTPTEPAATLLGDLAAAATIAALHTGVAATGAVHQRLGPGRPAIEFARRWLAGETPPDDAGDLTGRLVSPAELAAAVRHAESSRYPGDLATAFEAVLTRRRYRCGPGNLLGTYRRVVHGYRRGDFPAALTAAREIELIGDGETNVHQLARIWAAEMCRLTGEHQEADRWLATIGGPAADPALRVWAACGTPETRRADFPAAFAAYLSIAEPSSVGTALLVPRLIRLAVDAGDRDAVRRLRDDLEVRHGRDPHPMIDEALVLTAAVVTGNAVEAVRRARARDDRPALLQALLVSITHHSPPSESLIEAYELARDLRAAPVVARIGAVLRKHGVTAPAPRRIEEFSPLEQRILGQISTGHTNRQIGRQESLSEKTVEDHVSRLLTRTGCRSRVQLAALMLQGRIGYAE